MQSRTRILRYGDESSIAMGTVVGAYYHLASQFSNAQLSPRTRCIHEPSQPASFTGVLPADLLYLDSAYVSTRKYPLSEARPRFGSGRALRPTALRRRSLQRLRLVPWVHERFMNRRNTPKILVHMQAGNLSLRV